MNVEFRLCLSLTLVCCVLLQFVCGAAAVSSHGLRHNQQLQTLLRELKSQNLDDTTLLELHSTLQSQTLAPESSTFGDILSGFRAQLQALQTAATIQFESDDSICKAREKDMSDAMTSLTSNMEQTNGNINVNSERLKDVKDFLIELVKSLDPKAAELASLVQTMATGTTIRAKQRELNLKRVDQAKKMLQQINLLIQQINAPESKDLVRFRENLMDMKQQTDDVSMQRFLDVSLGLLAPTASDSALFSASTVSASTPISTPPTSNSSASNNTLTPAQTEKFDQVKTLLNILSSQFQKYSIQLSDTESVMNNAWRSLLSSYQMQKKLIEKDVNYWTQQKLMAMEEIDQLHDSINNMKDSIADIPERLAELKPQYNAWVDMCTDKEVYFQKIKKAREEQVNTIDALAAYGNKIDGTLLRQMVEKLAAQAIGKQTVDKAKTPTPTPTPTTPAPASTTTAK